jgi:SAM-dependent methyltransferase
VADRRIAETVDFFGPRAATWDERFPDDEPAFACAVEDLAPAPGATVLDAGCGTGRALQHLRHRVGPSGRLIAIDLTTEMLTAARAAGRDRLSALLVADALHVPVRAATVDAVFAAGLIQHLPAPDHGLIELARVSRSGARLAVFHPIGRAALAARHGRTRRDDDLLAAHNLGPCLARHGWLLECIDDGPDRYLALARRA